MVSRSSNMLIQPLETSIVRSIDVKIGQRVHAGDLLAQLDPTFAGADLTSLVKQTVSLKAEVTRLTAEAAGKPAIAATSRADAAKGNPLMTPPGSGNRGPDGASPAEMNELGRRAVRYFDPGAPGGEYSVHSIAPSSRVNTTACQGCVITAAVIASGAGARTE